MGKVYRVNTRNRQITLEALKDEYAMFGQRGLIAKVMSSEVNPGCDPLGKDNKLIVCTGLLAGTSAPSVHKLSIGGKSPLTGGIKESNVGGNAAALLAQHDIRAIIFEEVPEDNEWYILKVNKNSQVTLLPAKEYAGMNNYRLVEKLHEEFGTDIAVVSIGAAGERGYKIASLQVTCASTGHPVRAAARGGLGAVMGSKKIKALVIEKAEVRRVFNYIDKKRFMDARMKAVGHIKDNMFTGTVFPSMGTPAFTDMTAAMGILAVRNFSGDFFENEKLNNVNSKAFMANIKDRNGKTGVPCQPGCIVKCSNVYNDAQGKYLTSGLEYETIGLCGPNCDIDDLDFTAKIDALCDDLGVDTIEVGCTIAVCMEAGKIAWGDTKAALSLTNELIEGTEFGKLMGQGTESVGKALGVKNIPVVKGQALACYDPRNVKGVGVAYATSAMGADHTVGNSLSLPIEHTKKEGQVEISMQLQIATALIDNIMCSFPFAALGEHLDLLADMMAGVYGGEWNADKLLGIGIETLKLEKAFNKAAGLTAKDDRLPEFFYVEKSSATGAVFDINDEELAAVNSF